MPPPHPTMPSQPPPLPPPIITTGPSRARPPSEWTTPTRPPAPTRRSPLCADSSPNIGPSKPTKEGFYSADPSPHQPGCTTPLTVDTSPPPLELPAPSPNCERSTRGFGSGGKRVSFAEEQGSSCGPSGILPEEAEAEATGYSTDDEAEGGRRLWGAALERARYSPLLAPTRRDEAAHDAENRPAQRSNVHTVQEEGVAEALVLAACPSTAQVMPLMLLLSAGTAR